MTENMDNFQNANSLPANDVETPLNSEHNSCSTNGIYLIYFFILNNHYCIQNLIV